MGAVRVLSFSILIVVSVHPHRGLRDNCFFEIQLTGDEREAFALLRFCAFDPRGSSIRPRALLRFYAFALFRPRALLRFYAFELSYTSGVQKAALGHLSLSRSAALGHRHLSVEVRVDGRLKDIVVTHHPLPSVCRCVLFLALAVCLSVCLSWSR